MNRLPIADTNFKGGSTICESQVCGVALDCANHETAGDHRSESGKSPILFYTDGKVSCGGESRDDVSGIIYEANGQWMAWRGGSYGDGDIDLGSINNEMERSSYSPAIPTFNYQRGNKQN